eukprot:3441304-Rhodomonas_salina.2
MGVGREREREREKERKSEREPLKIPHEMKREKPRAPGGCTGAGSPRRAVAPYAVSVPACATPVLAFDMAVQIRNASTVNGRSTIRYVSTAHRIAPYTTRYRPAHRTSEGR